MQDVTSLGATAVGSGADPRVLGPVIAGLRSSTRPVFNVFDVMHHGLHEKQLSNVFAWLLDPAGTHGLGSTFAEIFLDEVNRGLTPESRVPVGPYVVHQEVNTGLEGDDRDIADLVLEGREAVVVVENYYTSDGHGHRYTGYLAHAERDGRRGVVVLLCRDLEPARLVDGWEHAAVITYATVIDRLLAHPGYRPDQPDVAAFLQQMATKFGGKGTQMARQDLLDLVAAMCEAGESRRYAVTPYVAADQQFGADLALKAQEMMAESRALLGQVHAALRDHVVRVLHPQLVEVLGQRVGEVSSRYSGVYRWTVSIRLDPDLVQPGCEPDTIELTVGPSARNAVMDDRQYRWSYEGDQPDYGHVFVGHWGTRQLRQSSVTVAEVLEGLRADDTRLREESLALLGISSG